MVTKQRYCYLNKKKVVRPTCIICVYYNDPTDPENSYSEDDPCDFEPDLINKE